jgi:hypothetical protein
MPQSSVTVLLPEDSESWSAFADRIAASTGEALVVLSGRESDLVAQPEIRAMFFKELKKHAHRVRIATKHPLICAEARSNGFRVFDRTKFVKQLLKDHPLLNETLRVFSPHLWRQQLTSRLQRMGLLALPRLRIFSLVGLSLVLFGFVVFRLLPSSEVRVVPRQEPISQTMNIFLALSGSTTPLPATRVRTLPLTELVIGAEEAFTFDHISKEFIGTPSKGELTVMNAMGEQYTFRKGTRFSNQAGMIFRSTESFAVPSGKTVVVKVEADAADIYGQIIGERGNVPVGVKWEIPGLSPEERKKVTAENKKAFAGGTTAFRTVLTKADIELAQKKLQEELLASAKLQAEDQRAQRGEAAGIDLQILDYPSLTKVAFSGFVLPTQFIGQNVQSVPVEGKVSYTTYVYDRGRILELLTAELQSHVREGRRLLPSSLDKSRLDVRVIDYADDLSWIKLTVELLGTEEYVLDPLSPNGAIFGKRLREKVVGQRYDDALRIVKNMPEVDRVSISIWPPWSGVLPSIPSHVSVVPE